jgi:uncharacterized membrane protein YhdT
MKHKFLRYASAVAVLAASLVTWLVFAIWMFGHTSGLLGFVLYYGVPCGIGAIVATAFSEKKVTR